MSKISELSDGGSLLPTDFLIAVRSGGNVKVQADQTEFDRIRLGDNEKIELGNNQDLQIYHNGSDSYIDNVGAGSLIIQDTDGNGDIYIRPKSGQTAIGIYNDNTVEIAHSGNVKLATTSIGITVTGSVTADGGTGTATSGGTLIVRQKGDTNADGIALTSSHAVSHRVWKDAGGNLNIGSSSYPSAFVQDFTGNVDIAGTATMDGLTVSNANGATLNVNTAGGGVDAKILLHETTTATSEYGASLKYSGANNRFEIGTGQDPETKRLSIDRDTGDISFYEDTGSSPKLHWDASDESLGIGTSSAATSLHVTDGGTPPTISGTYLIAATSASNAGIAINAGSSSASIIALGDSDSQDIGVIRYDHSDNSMRFNTAGALRLHIDNSGNVDIPNGNLSVDGQVDAHSLEVSNGGEIRVGGTLSSTTPIGTLGNSSGKLTLDTDSTRGIYFKTGGTLRQYIDGSTGDLSLYEDTGTTPKFFWDASDESLSLTKTAAGVTKALKLYNNTSGANNRVAIDFHTSNTLYGTIEAGYGVTSPEMNFKVGNTPAQILKVIPTGIDVSGSVTAVSGVFKNAADATGTTIKIQDNADRGITITSPVSGGAAAGRIATSGTANSLEIGVRDYPTALTIAGGSGAATFNGDIITATAGAANFRAGVNAGNSIVSGGNYNTVVGDEAGTAITEGDYNTALGYGALIADTKGARSVALGYRALAGQNFTTATNAFNVGIGHNAGTGILTGVENVLIGGRTGESITTGNYNVIVGNQSDSTAVSSEKAQGFGFSLACAAGYTTIGSGSDDIRAAHGNVTWATVSDERYKKDIADSEAGLSLINALRPRTFKYKTLGELPETFNAFEADSTEVFKNSDTNHGFIAQEVKAAIDADDSIKDGFRLWDDRDDGSQEVAEAALIPVLVKAIQELTARIETLEG